MNEMIGHVFGNLDIHNKAIADIYETMKKQKKLNRTTAVMMLFTTLTVYKLVAAVTKQNEKIESLTKEIEELKETKGE